MPPERVPASPETIPLQDVARQLAAGTRSGNVRWEPDADDTSAFRANFGVGIVLISRVVEFPFAPPRTASKIPMPGPGPFALDFLDANSRPVLRFRPTARTPEQQMLEDLFESARRQALDVDKTIDALLDAIKNRSGS